MKIIYATGVWVLSMALSACGAVNASALADTTTEYKAQKIATLTPVPTATVGWEATAMIAQQTADESRRLNTQATAEYEARIQEQIQFTATAEARDFAIYEWTATAAMTSIPLTATAQAVNSTAIVKQQALQAAAMTQTKEAPTQLVAMVNAETQKKFAPLQAVVNIFAMVGLTVFGVGIGIFALSRAGVTRVPAPQPPDDYRPIVPVDDMPETTVTVHHDNGAGYGTYERLRIPCTADQLKEIAGKILTGEKTLAFGQWEGTQVSRGVLLDFRNFLMANRFAVSAGMGQVALTHEGQ